MTERNILVVEDNDMNMQLVEFLLEEGGYRIVKATSGEEALAITRDGPGAAPDLILMDIHLPGMDGLSVVRAIKSDERTCAHPHPRPHRPRHARRQRPLPRSRLRRLHLEADRREDVHRIDRTVPGVERQRPTRGLRRAGTAGSACFRVDHDSSDSRAFRLGQPTLPAVPARRRPPRRSTLPPPMRMLVLGAGRMGLGAVHDLVSQSDVTEVTVADFDRAKAEDIARRYPDKARAAQIDCNDQAAVVALMRGHASAISCVNYWLNERLARAAIEAGTHFCDLGGNNDVVDAELALDAEARAAGVNIIPDCGLAPGMVSVLAAHGALQFETARRDPHPRRRPAANAETAARLSDGLLGRRSHQRIHRARARHPRRQDHDRRFDDRARDAALPRSVRRHGSVPDLRRHVDARRNVPRQGAAISITRPSATPATARSSRP